jgi:hypothetical protein
MSFRSNLNVNFGYISWSFAATDAHRLGKALGSSLIPLFVTALSSLATVGVFL